MVDTKDRPSQVPREFNTEGAFVALIGGGVLLVTGVWLLQGDSGSSTVCGRGWNGCVSGGAVAFGSILLGALGIWAFCRDVWRYLVPPKQKPKSARVNFVKASDRPTVPCPYGSLAQYRAQLETLKRSPEEIRDELSKYHDR